MRERRKRSTDGFLNPLMFIDGHVTNEHKGFASGVPYPPYVCRFDRSLTNVN
jgi:hypothetical protein